MIPSIYESARAVIMQQLMSNDSFTVAEICKLTGLSTTSVAKYLSQMRSEGLLDIVSQEHTGHKGRRAVRYGTHPGAHFFLGVDIKPNCLGVGLMNLGGSMEDYTFFHDFHMENTHECMEMICTKVQEFIDTSDKHPIVSAANFNIGGRVNSQAGTSASVFNFEETQDTPLAEVLSERLGFPVFIENDTKAMALGDYMAHCGEGWKNVLYVNIGWGLGLGIIINGKVYYGGNGYSGEMGHMHTYNNGVLCHCGKKGCMETEISGQAIVRKLTERIQLGESSVLSQKVRRGESITTEDIIYALEKEDPLCIELVSYTGTELGKQLAGIMNLLNPESIIIGGTLSKAASYYFLQYAALAVKQHSLKLISQHVPVLTSTLGDMAGITGACLLARNRTMGSKL